MVGGPEPHIGNRIRATRERLGWSRETLGSRSGVSWGAIAQMESGRRTNTRSNTLLALARSLGVTIEYLLGAGADLPRMFGHEEFSYQTDDHFLSAVERFIDEGLSRSEAVLVATKTKNVQLLQGRLGPKVDQIQLTDSSAFYGEPPQALSLYRSFVDRSVIDGTPWARIVSETPWHGRNGDETRILVVFESLLDLIFGPLPVTVLCPYDERLVHEKVIDQTNQVHPQIRSDDEVVPNDSYKNPAEVLLGAPPATG